MPQPPDKDVVQSFKTTVESLLIGVAADGKVRRDYLQRFVEYYGTPLKNYLTGRWRLSEHDAADVLQDFLVVKLIEPTPSQSLVTRFLEKRKASPSLRFRAYCLLSLRNFVLDRARAKRLPLVSLEAVEGFTPSDTHHTTDFDRFELDWATNLIEQAMQLVKVDCEEKGQPEVWRLFEARVVQPALEGRKPPAYEELALQLKLRGPKQAANRLQTAFRKFRTCFDDLIRSYLPLCDDHDEMVKQEIADLKQLAAGIRQGLAAETHHDPISSSVLSITLIDDLTSANNLWSDRDLPGLWTHLVSQPIGDFMKEVSPHLVEHFGRLLSDDQAPISNLVTLWIHPRPPLELLQALKLFALQHDESQGKQHQSELPPRFYEALYLATVATTKLRLGIDIAADTPTALRGRVGHALHWHWCDDITRDVLSEWYRGLKEIG